jgi:4-oxalocrotonate tautomerase
VPHVIVKLYPGRSEEDKARLAEAIVKDIMAIAGSPEKSVSVAIEDVDPQDWVEKVYKPDILGTKGKLYKKPGYDVPGYDVPGVARGEPGGVWGPR